MSSPSARSEFRGTAIAVVAVCFAFNFVARGVADAYAAFVLPLEAEFGWSRQSVTGVFATYMLMAGLGAPLAGMVFDRIGPRAVYGGGLLVLASGAWLSGRVESLWQLYLTAGLLTGLGASALGMVSATTLIARWHRRHLSKAIAIAYAGFGSGILVVLPAVQWAIEHHGWRFAYQALGVSVVVLWPLSMMLPWRRIAAGAPGGTRGPASHTVATSAPPPPAGRRSADDAESTHTPSSAASSQAVPTLRDALRTGAYWRLVQVFFFTSFATFLVTPQTVAFLVEAGYSPITAASALGMTGLLATAGLVATGWSVGRFGYARTALLTYASTAIGVAMLLLASYAPSGTVLAAHVAFFGIVQGSRGPIVSTLTSRIFGGPSAGTIYGTIFSSMSIGGAAGAYVGGALHDLTGSYRLIFVLSMVTIALAAAPFRGKATILGAAGVR
jgi:MFS family permease